MRTGNWVILGLMMHLAGCLPSGSGQERPENADVIDTTDAADADDVGDDCGPDGCDVEVDPCAEVLCGRDEVCAEGVCVCEDGGPEPCDGIEPSCDGQEGCRCRDDSDCGSGLSCLSGSEQDTGICADAAQTCVEGGTTLCDNGEDCITVEGPCSGTCSGVCLDEASFDRMCASESASGWDCSSSPTTYGCRELWECLIPTTPGTLGEQACFEDASTPAIQRYIDMAECAERNACSDSVCLENQCPVSLDACVGDEGIPEAARVDQTPFPCGGSLNPCPEQCGWVTAPIIRDYRANTEMATDGAGYFVFMYYEYNAQELRLATNADGFIRERPFREYPNQADEEHASVVIGPDGTKFIVFSEVDGPKLLMRDTSGQTIIETIPTSDDLIIFDTWDLAVDDNGGVHVAFADVYSEYAYRDPSGTWTQERIDYDVPNNAADLIDLTLDSNGVPHVVTQYRSCWPRYSNRLGGSWSSSDLDAGQCASHVDLAVDDSGVVHAVGGTDNLLDVVYFSNASGAWQAEQLAPEIAQSYGQREIAVTDAGEVHVTFRDPATSQISYFTRADGDSSWQESTFGSGDNIDLLLDRNDNLHFVYGDADGLFYRGWYCPRLRERHRKIQCGNGVTVLLDCTHSLEPRRMT